MLCQKKFHFLKRWSKHVLHWPHDTCMCFQAVCFEIICSDPREYCKFFLFGNSLQISQNILLSLPSNLGHLYFPSMPPGNLHDFLVKAGVSDAVLLSFIRLLLSSTERVQWALYLFPFQHTLAHILIHQRKIDKDLQNEIITKATILYPTVHFVS